ncbi:hypothetical protein KBD45_04385 [Candidatus Dojkabacteria bacterium]|nr:hypothetical protein [Candidatus Dojkabacteria bacterium]
MLLQSDIKDYLRDLLYIEEDVLGLLNKNKTKSSKLCEKIHDNIVEKQIIISRMVNLINISEENQNE